MNFTTIRKKLSKLTTNPAVYIKMNHDTLRFFQNELEPTDKRDCLADNYDESIVLKNTQIKLIIEPTMSDDMVVFELKDGETIKYMLTNGVRQMKKEAEQIADELYKDISKQWETT